MRYLALIVLGLLVTLASCQAPSQTSQEATVKALAHDPEFMAELLDFGVGLNRNEIRKLAAEYVAARHKGCNILGTQTTNYEHGLYFVGVDIGCKKLDSRTVYLAARRFVKQGDEKETYWKIEPMSPELNALMIGMLIKKAGVNSD